MLSHDEERRLAAIAQGLGDEDPRLARLLARERRTRRPAGWVLSGVVALSVLCVLVGAITLEATTLFGGLLLLGPALWLLVRRRRRAHPRGPAPHEQGDAT